MKRLPFGAFKAGYWRRALVGAEVQTRRVATTLTEIARNHKGVKVREKDGAFHITRWPQAWDYGIAPKRRWLERFVVTAPYAVGERVAITEAFRVVYNDHYTARVLYRCDEAVRRVDIPKADRCKPSVNPRNTWLAARFMPVPLSRGVGTVLDVRAEQLQDISVADAIAEGCVAHYHGGYEFGYQEMDPARANFRRLWDSINAARGYGWAANPWVFAFTVRKEAEDGL